MYNLEDYLNRLNSRYDIISNEIFHKKFEQLTDEGKEKVISVYGDYYETYEINNND
ncbi:MAG: hypothetical protein ACRCW0_09975 [Clostridium sp.]